MLTAIDKRQPVPMVLRVGIAGVRDLPPANSPAYQRICAEVDALFANLIEWIQRARKDERAAIGFDLEQPAQLRCLSPLAVGADRLLAKVALAHEAAARAAGIEIRLDVVTPFDIAEYRKTFEPEQDARASADGMDFDQLLARTDGRILQLDGSRDDEVRHSSYAAAGRTIVRNADLLVAIWDETVDSHKRGGTRDAVRFAHRAGVAIWTIDSTGMRDSRVDFDPLERFGVLARRTQFPLRLLRRYVGYVLAPPPTPVSRSWTKGFLRDPVRDYFDEKLQGCRRFWLLRGHVLGLIARIPIPHFRWKDLTSGGHPQTHGFALFPPWGRIAFDTEHRVTNQLALGHQLRYRTSYFLVVTFGAIALTALALGITFGDNWEKVTAVVEFALLAGMAGLVAANWRYGWHERYIDYRSLSEASRLAPYFSDLGYSLPFNDMRDRLNCRARNWVDWFTAAATRADPLAAFRIADQLGALRDRIIFELIDKQVEFHEKREHGCEKSGKVLLRLGIYLFIGTWLAIALKVLVIIVFANLGAQHEGTEHPLIAIEHCLISGLTLATLLGSTFSAALLALKAYEEFEPLEALSKETIDILCHARGRILRIDLAQPLASLQLARELFAVSQSLQIEVSGWGQLFRWRPVEA